mmetsp:Transcript_17765/g.50485  ORF Transcript_17765/g.50485 Transcript_17765/m.50485 type:complete len:272 (+) Transcript_17765:136-951(+)
MRMIRTGPCRALSPSRPSSCCGGGRRSCGPCRPPTALSGPYEGTSSASSFAMRYSTPSSTSPLSSSRPAPLPERPTSGTRTSERSPSTSRPSCTRHCPTCTSRGRSSSPPSAPRPTPVLLSSTRRATSSRPSASPIYKRCCSTWSPETSSSSPSTHQDRVSGYSTSTPPPTQATQAPAATTQTTPPPAHATHGGAPPHENTTIWARRCSSWASRRCPCGCGRAHGRSTFCWRGARWTGSGSAWRGAAGAAHRRPTWRPSMTESRRPRLPTT